MNSDLRFVFDSNAIVSASLLKKSATRQALDKTRRHGTLLFTLPTINELNDVLRREEFNKYVMEDERIQLLSTMMRESLLIEIIENITDCRDINDNKFLELAVSGKAICIVSGDTDLLVLHPFRGIPILTPREFLDYSWKKIG
jgi:hypothetical protein